MIYLQSLFYFIFLNPQHNSSTSTIQRNAYNPAIS